MTAGYPNVREHRFSHMQLDGGTTAARAFKNHPDTLGHFSFHPQLPTYYLCAIDTNGYEWMVWMGTEIEDGRAFFNEHKRAYGVCELVDFSAGGRA